MRTFFAVLSLCLAVVHLANGSALFPVDEEYSASEVRSLLKDGIHDLLKNFMPQNEAKSEQVKSLTAAGCSWKALDALQPRSWEACVNLTQAFTNAQQLGLDFFLYSKEVQTVGVEFYANVSIECNVSSVIEAATCFTEALIVRGPAFSKILHDLNALLVRSGVLHDDILKFYKGCFTNAAYFVDEEAYDLETLVQEFCPSGTKVPAQLR